MIFVSNRETVVPEVEKEVKDAEPSAGEEEEEIEKSTNGDAAENGDTNEKEDEEEEDDKEKKEDKDSTGKITPAYAARSAL